VRQEVYIEKGFLNTLEEVLCKGDSRHIFLVTGKSSYTLSGAKLAMEKILKTYDVTRYCEFDPNPQLPDVERGLKLFLERKYDAVIAVGGGSVLDVAKLIRICAVQETSPREIIDDSQHIQQRGVPLIAVPTTAGSGSEATHFAVVYLDKNKHSVAHEYVLPNVAIVESELTNSMPSEITAATGMDALSHAIESYWSINSTEESKKYARQAALLILNNLETVVKNPCGDSRKAMAKAAHLSGKAINISKTTACHAISYSVTSIHGVPHGHAVALTVPSMIVYNSKACEADTLDKRGVQYVRETLRELFHLLRVDTAEEAEAKLISLMERIHLNTRLRELNIGEDDLARIVEDASRSARIGNNPRDLPREVLLELLQDRL